MDQATHTAPFFNGNSGSQFEKIVGFFVVVVVVEVSFLFSFRKLTSFLGNSKLKI